MKRYQVIQHYAIYFQRYICPVCGKYLNHMVHKVDLHHRLHNTKANREKYPLFIDSLLNLLPVHAGCHDNANRFVITEKDAARYEGFLERHPIISKMVNGERV